MLASQLANSQNANLQVIHNAADPAAAVVDIYVNGNITLDDFEFREATEFLSVPSSTDLSIAVAPGSSTSVADALATVVINLDPGTNNIAVARGVLNPASFAANPNGNPTAFNLSLIENVDLSAAANNVKLLVGHNATDAPTVDIVARNVATLVPAVSYPQFSQQFEVPASDYLIDIKPAGQATIVKTYEANLSSLGGNPITVLASGFLDPTQNQSGEAFTLIAVTSTGTVLELAETAVASLQVIHNCADPLVSSVDIYVNGDIFLNNFNFREATEYTNVPANTDLEIAFAPAGSTSVTDAIFDVTINLENGVNYAAIAKGVVTPATFAANPDGISTSFGVSLIGNLSTTAPSNQVLLNIGHFSTDAPTVDIIARDVATLVNDAPFNAFASAITVPANNYLVDITLANDNSTIVKTYDTPLASFGGTALTVLASGFLNPATNNSGPAFTLIAVAPNGDVITLNDTLVARLQVIHNAADPGAAVVDIYVNNNPFLPDFAFRAASAYTSVPAGVQLNVQVAPGNSGSAAEALATIPVTLDNGKKYVAIANGVLNPANFAANPNSEPIAFQLLSFDGMREVANNPTETDLRILHGATDAPAVDVLANGTAIVQNAAYTDFTPYISVPSNNIYILTITPAGVPATVVAEYTVDMAPLAGASAVVFASGFLAPASNQNGEPFGLFAALVDGTVIELSNTTSIQKNNTNNITFFPNPVNNLITLTNMPSESMVEIYDVTGKMLISKQINNTTETIDMENLNSGIYMIRAMKGQETILNSKIVKQ